MVTSETVELKKKFFEGIDFVQRVNNFSLRPTGPEKALLPLFEAIANSIHSIEESEKKDGLISISIDRRQKEAELFAKQGRSDLDKIHREPIQGFSIIDNGIGFDNIRFNAFVEADTGYKVKNGGKGIGRYSWLKAFKEISVESVFEEAGTLKVRNFEFRHTPQAIHNLKTKKTTSVKTGTTIRLLDYKPIFSAKAPKTAETIARRIVEHFLFSELYDLEKKIEIIDIQEEERISLNNIFSSGIKADFRLEDFKIGKYNFHLQHLKLYAASEASDHRIHFCGGGREVTRVNLSPKIKGLKSKNRIQEGSEKSFIYVSYISGKYLDENLNSQRTGFDILESPTPLYEDLISWPEIIDKALVSIEAFLSDFLKRVSEENQVRIKRFISSNYKYRPLLEFKQEGLSKIKPRISDKELDVELHKLLSELELEVKRQEKKFLSKTFLTETQGLENSKQEYHDFLEKNNALGKYKLAEYVVHRKVVLKLLNSKIFKNADGKFSLEKEVHDIFHPMGKNSNQTFLEQKNLWIIDEKLAYHQYLASDKAMKTYDGMEIDSDERTDITIFDNNSFFDNRHLFTIDPSEFSSVVLVEFKRPMREEYSEEENPIQKAYSYAKKIREGKAKDRGDSYITVGLDMPIYCYIICDLTPKLRDWAHGATLTECAHKDGFFGYNPHHKTFLEIMTFKKLLLDANKRNKVLFDKLGLPEETT